jgi:hypothetical protein
MDDRGRRPDLKVRYHAGYKGGETPRSLLVSGREFPVERVLSRQRVLDAETGATFDVFRIRIKGKTVVVRRNESGESELLSPSDLSFLESPG